MVCWLVVVLAGVRRLMLWQICGTCDDLVMSGVECVVGVVVCTGRCVWRYYQGRAVVQEHAGGILWGIVGLVESEKQCLESKPRLSRFSPPSEDGCLPRQPEEVEKCDKTAGTGGMWAQGMENRIVAGSKSRSTMPERRGGEKVLGGGETNGCGARCEGNLGSVMTGRMARGDEIGKGQMDETELRGMRGRSGLVIGGERETGRWDGQESASPRGSGAMVCLAFLSGGSSEYIHFEAVISGVSGGVSGATTGPSIYESKAWMRRMGLIMWGCFWFRHLNNLNALRKSWVVVLSPVNRAGGEYKGSLSVIVKSHMSIVPNQGFWSIRGGSVVLHSAGFWFWVTGFQLANSVGSHGWESLGAWGSRGRTTSPSRPWQIMPPMSAVTFLTNDGPNSANRARVVVKGTTGDRAGPGLNTGLHTMGEGLDTFGYMLEPPSGVSSIIARQSLLEPPREVPPI
ncbi:hypothetical protein EDB92DRAFT_1819914 [Lactarius akahatsu]|uniref:Uncharacterized protein n=1 Tax=Lactarius akahatsu TaxID=416441 RepID=A0AAD4LBR4_9AGAM|nr:hypothetical protein EDB92DRAFT_1819914 [Lactarius akahatsu]